MYIIRYSLEKKINNIKLFTHSNEKHIMARKPKINRYKYNVIVNLSLILK